VVAGSAGGGGGLGSGRDGSRSGGRGGDRETRESESKHLLAVMCIQIAVMCI
jgi:hypothetical protein